MRRKIYFRVDGNSTIGLGHITRCLVLASILKDESEICFITQAPSQDIRNKISEITHLIIVIDQKPVSEDEISDYLLYLGKSDVLVLDGYAFDTSYQRRLRNEGIKIVSIDDIHKYRFVSNAVINHSPSVRETDYSVAPETRLYLGLSYALLRNEFLKELDNERKIELFQTVLVCIGGADPDNLTCMITDACFSIKQFKRIHIVTGSAYQYQRELKNLIADEERALHHHNISAIKMIEVMKDSQIAVCPSSTIAMELFCVGINLITGYFVENQIEFSSYIHENKLGFSLGNFKNANADVVRKAIFENSEKDYFSRQKKLFKGNPSENLKQVFSSI